MDLIVVDLVLAASIGISLGALTGALMMVVLLIVKRKYVFFSFLMFRHNKYLSHASGSLKNLILTAKPKGLAVNNMFLLKNRFLALVLPNLNRSG